MKGVINNENGSSCYLLKLNVGQALWWTPDFLLDSG